MVSVWVAVLGIVGTLAAAVLTQILTNQREFQRDQLKWAQERQQRELDVQKAALSESLLALDRWHTEAYALSMHLVSGVLRKGDANKFPELEQAARSGVVGVELVCSDEAIEATRKAMSAVYGMSLAVTLAANSAQNEGKVEDGLRYQADEMGSMAFKAMAKLRKVYRVELAKLAAEPVVLPSKSRKWLRLPWRKSD